MQETINKVTQTQFILEELLRNFYLFPEEIPNTPGIDVLVTNMEEVVSYIKNLTPNNPTT